MPTAVSCTATAKLILSSSCQFDPSKTIFAALSIEALIIEFLGP